MKLYNFGWFVYGEKLFRNFSLLLFSAVCITLLNGCASSVALNKQIQKTKQPVTLSQDVSLPGKMYYQGFGDLSMAPAFGISGLLVEMSERGREKSHVKPVDVVTYVMEKSEIDVRKIVLNEFEKQIRSAGLFSEIVYEDKNYPELRLSIFIHGFAQPHGLSKQLKPLLGIEGILVSQDNSILWKNSDYVTNLNGQTPSHTVEEYISNPELMRKAFHRASEIAVGNLVSHMRGE